ADPFRAPIRWRSLALVGGAAALVCSLLAWRVIDMRMPGASFEGPPPAATAEERALAIELERDVRALAIEIGERNDRRPAALARARDYLEQRLRAVGLSPSRDGYEANGVRVDNLVAQIGTGRALLVGAHYDSAIGAPGANDDASGV